MNTRALRPLSGLPVARHGVSSFPPLARRSPFERCLLGAGPACCNFCRAPVFIVGQPLCVLAQFRRISSATHGRNFRPTLPQLQFRSRRLLRPLPLLPRYVPPNLTLSFTVRSVLFPPSPGLVPFLLSRFTLGLFSLFSFLFNSFCTSFAPTPSFLFWYFRTTIPSEHPTFFRVRLRYRFSCRPRGTLFSERMPYLCGEKVQSWPPSRT